MAITKVQIISNALAVLGHAPIVSLGSSDQLVVAAEQAFDFLLPSVLSQNNWRFATRIQQLTELSEPLPPNWVNGAVYLLPAGFLKTLRFWPRQFAWDIYENQKIYSLYKGDFWMEFVVQPDVSLLPPHFTTYFSWEIATYLSLSNAQKTEYYTACAGERTRTLAMAAAIEAQNRPQFTETVFPVLNNRYIGTIIGNTI